LSKAADIVKSQNLKVNDESDLWGTMIEYHPEWLEEPRVGARVYANSGNALYRLGKPKKALQDYSLAINSDPTCGRLYVYRGIVLEELNRTNEAFADYVKGTEVDPNCAVAWASKGTGLMAKGSYPEAKAALLKGSELFSSKPTPSPDEARLDAALPWAGLPRGFFFCVVNLAVAEYEVGDTASAQQRIDSLNTAMKDKPLAAAKAAGALMVLANKGGSSNGIVDFEAEKAWKQVEDIDYRWHKQSFASKSIQWGPKLADALTALRQNKFISA
jgi:tetratricopeptide (TPR) repeat protein